MAGLIGSPPRAWGRLSEGRRACRVNRFTPTCVGTATAILTFLPAHLVHPHVRGDGRRIAICHIGYLGSPPRAWGRLVAPELLHPLVGFTPTCVGTAC